MKVLLAIDGSRFSEAAAKALIQRVEPESAEVCVFHAVEPPYLIPYYYVGTQQEIDTAEENGRRRGEQLARRATDHLEEAGFTVSSFVDQGDPRTAIVRYAEQWPADLIVMGSQGRTGLNRFLIGSVAEYVARHACCSVWIVRDQSDKAAQILEETSEHKTAHGSHQAVPAKFTRSGFASKLSKPPCYVTAPLGIRNSDFTVEDLCGSVLSDAIARHKRMCGFDVAFLAGASGFQPHPDLSIGMPADGMPVKESGSSGNGKHRSFDAILDRLNVAPTHHSRTGSMVHANAVQTLLRRTMRRSVHAIHKTRYEGRYCVQDNLDVTGSTAPAKCPVCGRAAELISEQRYFFRLSSFKDWLLALYEHQGFVVPAAARKQAMDMVQRGTPDICISSRPGTGIPWPGDARHAVGELYCKLVVYLSAIGFGDGSYAGPDFERYWPARLHVFSEGQFRACAIYWPAFLMAADLPVPHEILAYQSEASNVTPMQRTSGFASLDRAIEVLGSDPVRYHILRNGGFARTGGLDYEEALHDYQYLRKTLGALAELVVSIVHDHCGGRIPRPYLRPSLGEKVMLAGWKARAEVRSSFDEYDFARGLCNIWELMDTIQQVIAENDPAKLAEDRSQRHRLANVVYDACEGLGYVAQLLHPVMPETTNSIWKALGQTTTLEDQQLGSSIWGGLYPGAVIGSVDNLFPRIHEAQEPVSIEAIPCAPHELVPLKKAV